MNPTTTLVTIHPRCRPEPQRTTPVAVEEQAPVAIPKHMWSASIGDIRVNLVRLRPQVNEGGDARFEAGCWLMALRRKSAHGTWSIHATECGFSVRHARKLIQFATGVVEMGLTNEDVKGFGIDQLNRMGRVGRKKEYHDQIAAIKEKHTDGTAHPNIVVADALDYLKRLKSNSVPFIITDPPYGIGRFYGDRNNPQPTDWQEADNPTDHGEWIRPYWDECRRVVAPGGSVVFWQSPDYLPYFPAMFPGALIDILPRNYRGSRTYEPLVRWTKPGGKPHHPMPTVLPIQEGRKDNQTWNEHHPCPKNSYEVRVAVRFYATPGSVVLDPFLGTGTIAAEALKWGCVPHGCDRNPEYVKLTLARLAEC